MYDWYKQDCKEAQLTFGNHITQVLGACIGVIQTILLAVNVMSGREIRMSVNIVKRLPLLPH